MLQQGTFVDLSIGQFCIYTWRYLFYILTSITLSLTFLQRGLQVDPIVLPTFTVLTKREML